MGHNRLRQTEEDDPEKGNFPPIYLNYDRYKLPALFGVLVFSPLHGSYIPRDDHKPAGSLKIRSLGSFFLNINLPQGCSKLNGKLVLGIYRKIYPDDMLGFWGNIGNPMLTSMQVTGKN